MNVHKPSINLDGLPILPLQKIFEILESEDRVSLGLVNRRLLGIFHSITSWTFTEGYDLFRIARNLQMIKKIELNLPCSEGLMELLSRHPEIIILKLTFSPSIERIHLKHILSSLDLRELSIIHSNELTVTTNVFANLVKPKNLSFLDLSGCQSLSNTCVSNIVDFCGFNLKTLKLRELKKLTNDGLKVISEKCPRLKSLDLSSCDAITGDGLVQLRSLDLHTLVLQSLSLPAVKHGLEVLFRALPGLESVYLSYSQETTPGEVCYLVSSVFSLRHLFMANCQALEPQPWQLALQSPQLKSLGVRGCSNLDENSVGQFSSTHNQLEYLDLSRTNVNDNILGQIVDRNPALTHVFLGGCNDVTDKSLVKLIQKCPNLQILDVKGTSITDDALISLTAIRFLSVLYCDKISEKTKKVLMQQCPRIQRIQSFFTISTCDTFFTCDTFLA